MITLVALALAVDPSPRPTLTDDTCAPIGGKAGASLVLPCSGVFVPLPRAAWYASMVVWADETDAIRRLEDAAHADELARRDAEVRYWREMAARPVPVWERPGVAVSVGVLGGVGIAMITAWGWGQVAR